MSLHVRDSRTVYGRIKTLLGGAASIDIDLAIDVLACLSVDIVGGLSLQACVMIMFFLGIT